MKPEPNVKNPKAMIIKNIPADIRQASKIAAAELGITLQAFHTLSLKFALAHKETIKGMIK